MKVHRYSRWDGTQHEFTLDAGSALDALSELMMHGLDARAAMQYLRHYGFALSGQDFRVMGIEELLSLLRKQARKLQTQYHLDGATEELERKLRELLAREQEAVRDKHGYESRKMNDFLERRHAPSATLADAIERFADYEFEDERAAREFEELAGELERLRALEEFVREHRDRFRGRTAADYETAQRIREELQGIEQMTQALSSGELEQVDPERLGELLGGDATRSLIVLRDLEPSLRERGYLRTRDGRDELTPQAVRRIGAQALASVYANLRKGRQGGHETTARGVSLPRPDETRPYRYGDALDLDVVRSILNGLQRERSGHGGSHGDRFELRVEDLEVRDRDFSTQSTTVLLLDLSWSMSFEGRFPAAKRVALAMHQLIRTRFPRDRFFVVGFSTRARELRVDELPEVSWDPGDPFTNLQEGLMVAERLIARHPSPSPQVLVITDGQPTAYFVDDELHVEWPNSYGGISPRAVAQTLKQVQRITRRGITINTFMLHDSPELVGFVERMTEINRGRALFTDPQRLGSFVMVDHLTHRRKRG